MKARRARLIRAIRAYQRDCRRYSGKIFVTTADIYSYIKNLLPWHWRIDRMMPERKFRIIESYLED